MSVVAVERALILLRYIVDNVEGLSIREVSRIYGYSPATVQKLVKALEAQGFVVQDDKTERYTLGTEAVQLGFAALARLDIRRIAQPYLETLSKQTGETVFLGIARNNYAIYIDKVVSEQSIRMDAPLGVNRPYNCTAIGKILLADSSDEELKRLERVGAIQRKTEFSITDLDSLRSELNKIQAEGWAGDNEEYNTGARCIAAPVKNYNGETIAAITVTGPADRINPKVDELIVAVKTTAAAISREIGH